MENPNVSSRNVNNGKIRSCDQICTYLFPAKDNTFVSLCNNSSHLLWLFLCCERIKSFSKEHLKIQSLSSDSSVHRCGTVKKLSDSSCLSKSWFYVAITHDDKSSSKWNYPLLESFWMTKQAWDITLASQCKNEIKKANISLEEINTDCTHLQ